MPAVKVDTVGCYTVVSENKRLGVYDKWKNVNVTSAEFDVFLLCPASRRFKWSKGFVYYAEKG